MIFIIYTSWDNIVDNITRDRRRPYLVKWFTKFKALAFLQRFHWHLVVISLSEMENCKIHYKHFQTKITKSVTGGENGAMRIGSYFLSFLFKALSLTKVHASVTSHFWFSVKISDFAMSARFHTNARRSWWLADEFSPTMQKIRIEI